MELDIFEDALATVFDAAPLLKGDPGTSVIYARKNPHCTRQSITVHLANVRQNVKLMAQYLWASSTLMADLIDTGVIDVRNTR